MVKMHMPNFGRTLESLRLYESGYFTRRVLVKNEDGTVELRANHHIYQEPSAHAPIRVTRVMYGYIFSDEGEEYDFTPFLRHSD